MSAFSDVREFGSRFQNYNLEVFQEPRGVIRILQLLFAVVTAVVLRSYEGYIDIKNYCLTSPNLPPAHIPFEYPFNLDTSSVTVNCSNSSHVVTLMNDFSSEAEFLFTTCWLSVIFIIIIVCVYIKCREDYETNGNLALIDFVLSVILAVLWIASFGAWGYGQSELKKLTHPDSLKSSLHVCVNKIINCSQIFRGSVLGLTESLILSFLNFFLWAAGLWFLYKETPMYLQFQRA